MEDYGLIINSYGRQFIVEVAGISYNAVTKSKKTDYVVGDIVKVNIINLEQLQIIDLDPRKNLVYRSDHNRSKIIASNIDQILIIIAIKPNFNVNFLNNCLLFAESEGIKPIIIINKADLPESKSFIEDISKIYASQLGYPLITLSAINDCESLRPILNGNQSLLIGQSGVGKSTITSKIVDAKIKIGEINKAGTSGCHTTTNATLYHINDNSTLIDCPGLQDFGLFHLELDQLPGLFPEIREYLGNCKFRNCRHLDEPGCKVSELYHQGKFNQSRYNLFVNLSKSLISKVNRY